MTPEQTAFLETIERLFGKAHADSLKAKLEAGEAEFKTEGETIVGIVDRD